jgi:hypothetical protein
MDYKKISSPFVAFFFLFVSCVFSEEYIYLKSIPQNHISHKQLKRIILDIKRENNFNNLLTSYYKLLGKTPLIRKGKHVYISILPMVRAKFLTSVHKNRKKWKMGIGQKITKMLMENKIEEVMKLLYIVPQSKHFASIWAKFLVKLIERGDCYYILYALTNFKRLSSLFSDLEWLLNSCKESSYSLQSAANFNTLKYKLKGSLNLIEDINVEKNNIRKFFNNYGFVRNKEDFLFYNGHTLYRLQLNEKNVNVSSIFNSPTNFEDVFVYDYGGSKKDFLLTYRENFNILANENEVFLCEMSEREEGERKVRNIGGGIFALFQQAIPKKYPRFFREFVVFDYRTLKIKYFGLNKADQIKDEKLSCQGIYGLNKNNLLISSVGGENTEPFSHYLLKFDLAERKIIWKTYISSGFMERNLFNNPVFESWGNPISCSYTFCIYTTDLGNIVSIDHITGSINWFINIPVYKFRGTLRVEYFDKLPYLGESLPPLIKGNNIFVSIPSNPSVYKITLLNGIPRVSVFEGDEIVESKSSSDIQTDIFNDFRNSYINAPRFVFGYKDVVAIVYDKKVKIKDYKTGKIIYSLRLPSEINGPVRNCGGILTIPVQDELILFSLDNFKILYQVNIFGKKVIAITCDGESFYILFKDELWKISYQVKNKE